MQRVIAAALASPLASCGSSGQTSPTPVAAGALTLSVERQPSLIVGEVRPCGAFLHVSGSPCGRPRPSEPVTRHGHAVTSSAPWRRR
jgi:hypothetical protein